ncbi:MAG: DnaB-like helicase C-terminal domain-containing protein [Caldisericia bacterium]
MSIEIEKKILKGFIVDRFAITKSLSEGFRSEYFEDPKTILILNAIFDIYEGKGETEVLDFQTLNRHLEKKGVMDVDIKNLLDEIEKIETPNLALLISYIDILRIRNGERRLINIADEIIDFVERRGPHKAEDISQFSVTMSEELQKIAIERLHKKLVPSEIVVKDIIRDIYEKRKFHGFSIEPFISLDKTLLGLRPGFYYAIAGAPRRGKTNFLLHLATNIIRNERVPVLYYSWEQTSRILNLRILSQESYINPVKLISGDLNEDEFNKFDEAYKRFQEYSSFLYIIEGASTDTLEKIEAHAYNIMQSHRCENVVIFLDYIQKIPIESPKISLEEKVDELSSKIAMLSLSLKSPIVAISSLDKEGCKLDEEGIDRPTMFHSTGGGDIEYDSDVAMVLVKNHKETNELNEKLKNLVKNGEILEEDVPMIDVIDLYIDKNRDAPEGISNVIQYLFFIESNKFLEIGFKDTSEKYTYAKMGLIVDRLKNEGLLKLKKTNIKTEKPKLSNF